MKKIILISVTTLLCSTFSHPASAIGYPVNLVGKRTSLSKGTKIEATVKQALTDRAKKTVQTNSSSFVKAASSYIFHL